jgi:RNA polymerase sigma factor (sigma-70 family)
MTNKYEIDFYSIKTTIRNSFPRVRSEIFEECYQEAIIAFLNSKVEIQRPRDYFYCLVNSRILNATYSKYNEARTRQGMRTVCYGGYSQLAEISPTYEMKIEFRNIQTDVRSAIETLPDQQRKILKELVLQDKTLTETAQDNNINYDTCKANYRHALKTLKKKLKHLEDL